MCEQVSEVTVRVCGDCESMYHLSEGSGGGGEEGTSAALDSAKCRWGHQC